jgi:hypothetical protein
METKAFLEAVLGNEGSYCVFAVRDGRIVQKFYTDIDSVVATADNLHKERYDTYFALGTFEKAGSRTQDNVKQLKSFYIDLDCGGNKPYANQAAALAALKNFCKSFSFPKPSIVNSGHGIHAYWALDNPISREEWAPVATKFKAFCARNNLHIDAAVTADCARILRVPGTRNFKGGSEQPVALLGSVAPAVTLDAFCTMLNGGSAAVPAGAIALPPDSFMDALTGNMSSRFKTIVLKTVAGNGCAQLAEVISNQAGISEPLWRAGLSIAKFCVDGDKAIHKISSKHPDYNPDETNNKAAAIKGPYLCERFDEYRPGVCTECKHWKRIKSPISLGREIEASEGEVVVANPATSGVPYVIPVYPSPYFRGKNGGVWMQDVDRNGDPKTTLIYINDLYVVRRLVDKTMGEAVVLRLHLPRDGMREFTVALSVVGTRDEFRKQLAAQGVAVMHTEAIAEYVMKWVNELQFKTHAEDAHRQFGWVGTDFSCFAAGGKLIYKDRVETNAPASATVGLFPAFEPKGTLTAWKQNIALFERDGMQLHQFVMCMSFGSVLMEFQSLNAAAFHVYSKESGLGKTTAMIAGLSIWGNPDQLMLKEKDTINSQMNRAEVFCNLPVYIDELTNTQPKELSDYGYQLTSGQQKNRMSSRSNIERVRGRPWKTLFASTGNTSVIERISAFKASPQAEAQRILEHRVNRVAFSSKAETDRFYASLKDNYGHAGVVFIQYVMNNLDMCTKLADEVQSRIDTLAKLSAENRFWSVLTSRTIAGAIIAKRAGLINFDTPKLVKWVVEVLNGAKIAAFGMEGGVESTLVDYLAENHSNILRIKSTDDRRGNNGRKTQTEEQIVSPESVPRIQIVGRYEYDVKRLFLLAKPLRNWCVKNQINFEALCEGLKIGRTQLRRDRARIGKGTHIVMPPSDVLILDCTGFLENDDDGLGKAEIS